MVVLHFIAAALVSLALVGGASAQQGQIPNSPVLTVDVEALFSDSAFGKRIARDYEQRRAELVAEGLIIQGELEDEEKSLVEKRKTMEPTEFRALADAFDRKVQTIRKEQDDKARALGQGNDSAQRDFLRAAKPVLEAVMSEAGAAVILDQRSIFLRTEQADITAEAIRRIDAEIGDGAPPTTAEPDGPQPPE